MEQVAAGLRSAVDLVRAGWWIIGLGFVSLVMSIVASGLDYIEWEKSGAPVSHTPAWILAWHELSFVTIAVGVALVVIGLVIRRRRR